MKITKDSVPGMTIALGLICIVAAAALAFVYKITAEPIEKARLAKQNDAIAAVLPPFNNNPVDDAVSIDADDDNTEAVTLFPAYDNGKFVGAAVSTWTVKGFSGRFDLIVGFDAKGAIVGYEIMSHAETPGLGAKMTQWFAGAQPGDKKSIINKNPSKHPLKVSKDGGDVDAITAATITSRAFLDAINRAGRAFTKFENQNQAEK